jgi:guanosine-3',5'-bis(diphosphate) 3'-pyrophosphohydrolase
MTNRGGKDAERWIDVEWGEDIRGQFRTIVEVQIRDDRGALGRVAAEIAASEANIVNVTMDEEPDRVATIRFTLQVRSRQHLAQVFRQVRKQADVTKITRLERSGDTRLAARVSGNLAFATDGTRSARRRH